MRRARPRDDALVGRPRRRRLPHGRDQPDLQGHRTPRRTPDLAGPRPRAPLGRAQRPAAAGVPRRDEPGGRAHRPAPAHGRRDAGQHGRAGPRGHRPGASRARHGVHLRARRPRRGAGRGQVGPAATCRCPCSRPTSPPGRRASPTSGWNSLYWDNHDQPRAVSRFGDDSPEHRVASAKTLGTVLHLHRGTPYVYQGEELGMTNAGFTTVEEYADLESVNWAREALARGVPEADVLPVAGRQESRQRPHAHAVGRVRDRRLHDRYAVAAGQPRPRRDQRGGRGRRPGLGVPPLPAADRAAARRPGRGRRALHSAAPGRPAGLGVHPHPRRRQLLVLANCSSTPATVEPGDLPVLDGSEILLPTHGASYTLTLQPWESRLHRL